MAISSSPSWAPGTAIVGKWRGNRYIVDRLLGKGANGIVYLVHREGRREKYALKIGYDTLDLQSEINVLTSLQSREKSREHRGGRAKKPSRPAYLLEADDDQEGGFPFYVMRYVQGSPPHVFLRRKGRSWLGLIGLKLLDRLCTLHECGFVFGDLKPENIVVSDYGEAELIDYGGAGPKGRSVKQFTEWHDRGFWNAGSRSADEGYDLFAFAVLCLRLLDEQGLKTAAAGLPQTRSVDDLLKLAVRLPDRGLSSWLKLALKGGFPSSREAREAWKTRVYRAGREAMRHDRVATPGWLVGAFVLSLLVLAATLYWMAGF
ncbi:serine/threonine protein kinase [Paenibacillus spiritus]|uniref:Serine/threonine protein kinase n=1 Tax=Paenibacillus spiritus TaxID=2496557 RepID=A0A5J5G7U1_9BACL|nr:MULTISPECIES: serine/threonine protein kinase [Paenibacillus]KAA9003608.1 serine/threonine protein kinase [Paenibacillus spiritus]